jgi:phenylalanyl-tRNA synthetase beta chain
MKVSVSWLRDYVDVDLSPEELARRLTLSGTKVEHVDHVGAQWRDILVGRITRLEPHPDPDVSLQLATVSLGERGQQTVVTGAFNITVGDKVPYAGLGVTLATGVTIKPRKLRGVLSEGMVLADDELGLGEDHTSIRLLDPAAPEGRPLSEVLGDAILDLEITTNRPDCLSVLGIAREVAAITGKTLRLPEVRIVEGDGSASELLAVRVEDPVLCPRFVARVITGVTVGPSPEWMVARLQAAGVRAINNVVDVTNYVMLEYGQPMHPYDAALLAAQAGGCNPPLLVIRHAREGETLQTLDGQTRLLTPEMLVIADGAGTPIGLAGIMGGATTEVSEATTTVALEVANWNPANIRRTSTRLGLRTEASTRFEKGLPAHLTALAADRAAALIAELAGGTGARGLIDVGEVREERRTIVLPASEPRRLLGMDVDRTQIMESLSPLGFAVQTAMPGAPDVLDVTVPPWREDVAEAADLVEEIARMIGYDKVPETMLRGGVPARELDRGFYWWRRLRSFLLACGLSEATNHSLTGDAQLARLRAPDALEAGPLSEDEIAALVPNSAAVTAVGATYGPLRLQNPMAPDRDTLRPTLMAGLLDNLSLNLRSGAESVRLFELGRAYFPRVFQAPDPTRLPALERRTLGIALAGLREERSWDGPTLTLDFFDLKGIVEELMAYCGVATYGVEPAGHPVLHPGRAARLRLADGRGRPATELAVLGEVHPEVAARFDLRERALLLELDVDALAAVATTDRTYQDVPRYPAVKRDLAVVVARSTPAADVLRAVQQGGGKLLRTVRVFDVYTGEQIGADQKSLALSLVFQDPDRTLTERRIDGVVGSIQRLLQDTVGATFRA